MDWDEEDDYMLSASADCSVKIWRMKYLSSDDQQRLDYSQNDENFFHAQIPHFSYVYSAKFLP